MYKRNLLYIFLLGGWSLFIFNPLNAQIENWPQFRGINCSGIADENQDPPISFGKDQNMIWNTNLSTGQSSPCIWQDNIFITGFEEEDKLLKMYCIDRISGAIQWQKEISVKEFEKFKLLVVRQMPPLQRMEKGWFSTSALMDSSAMI